MTNQVLNLSRRSVRSSQTTTFTRIGARVGSALLTFAAFLGALCIAALIASQLFQLSIILFSTGSMSPTMPTGAIAVVKEIPADTARVGQVVTVNRPGELPITHRIVSATHLSNGSTELVLRGDANKNNDPAPYTVTSVRLVVASVPWGAQVVAFISTPLFLIPATMVAALLVAWAFWPRKRARLASATAVATRPEEVTRTTIVERTPSHRAETKHLRREKSNSELESAHSSES